MSLFRPKEKRSISFQDVFGRGADVDAITSQGIERALSLVPVYAATSRIAGDVSSLPLHGFRDQINHRQRMDTAPQLLRDPTLFGTTQDWVHRALTSLLLRGNAYGLITDTDGMGFPIRVEWLHPDEVHVDDDRAVTRPVWRWLGQRVPEGDLLHIPAYSVPGRVLGLSPIKAFQLQLDTGLLAQTFGRDFFKAGGHPKALLKHAKPVDEDGAKRVRDRFMAAVRGRDPAVMGGGWEYEAIQVKPEEAQFLATLRLNATQIASIYHIPPELVGGEVVGSNITYANVGQRLTDYVFLTLRPWITKFEAAITSLLPARQLALFRVDDFTRADVDARVRSHTESLIAGWRSVNEVRRLEDLEPIESGDNYLWPPRRQQLTELEIGFGADDESGEHDAEDKQQLAKELLQAEAKAKPDPPPAPAAPEPDNDQENE